MKKLLLVLGATLLVLSACQNTTEDSVTSQSTSREQQTKEVTNYFHYLADSYEKALSHEKEVKGATVQSPMVATLVAMEELQLSHPTDQALIMKNYSDFQKLIQYNTEKWQEEFASWASSMGQSYHRLEHIKFDEKNELIKKLETTTVSQKRVRWNIFGVSSDNAYDYLVLDAYYDDQARHFYLFTLKDGQAQVLYADKTLETIRAANFEETENTDLAQGFKEFLLKTSVATENEADSSTLTDKIKTVMESYSDSKGEKFKSTNLATYSRYYGLAVPDQIMQFGQVDGVNYTFKWHDYTVGVVEKRFEILACYVNEAGTEVILFGYKDGRPTILHTEGQPEIEKNEAGTIINAQVHFVSFPQPILEGVFN
ncbi:DUF4767 domain-containing protein [Streptococcus infantis]|uniref:DUF4767 domain-containing protein n=1 Tax=Streptococcus TaxID=1301 RepID=UPI00034E5520|nr:DUF4767 domain-containing protein [Streptococcus sp. HPH0090]EPD82936.1 hypothetical protein HMPREF1481_01615 [Streptococcus sp. HPH0090]